MKRFDKEQVSVTFVSDFGMTIEVAIDTGDVEEDAKIDYPLMKIYADEGTERRYAEISSGSGLVQIPLSVLKEVIELAEDNVHSDSWFDNNVFKDIDSNADT